MHKKPFARGPIRKVGNLFGNRPLPAKEADKKPTAAPAVVASPAAEPAVNALSKRSAARARSAH